MFKKIKKIHENSKMFTGSPNLLELFVKLRKSLEFIKIT